MDKDELLTELKINCCLGASYDLILFVTCAHNMVPMMGALKRPISQI